MFMFLGQLLGFSGQSFTAVNPSSDTRGSYAYSYTEWTIRSYTDNISNSHMTKTGPLINPLKAT